MIHWCKRWGISYRTIEPRAELHGFFISKVQLKWYEDSALPASSVGLVLINADRKHIGLHVFITRYDGNNRYEWKSTGEINPHPKDIACLYGRRCCILVKP